LPVSGRPLEGCGLTIMFHRYNKLSSLSNWSSATNRGVAANILRILLIRMIL